MATKKLDLNDLDKTLRDFGFKEGDELELPSEKQANEQSESNEEGDEADTGGGAPPPDKERP